MDVIINHTLTATYKEQSILKIFCNALRSANSCKREREVFCGLSRIKSLVTP